MFWGIFLHVCFCFTLGVNGSEYNGGKVIELNHKNNILLRGVINQQRASQVIHEINRRENKSELYLILDTPGGDVTHGMQIIGEVQSHNLNCIVQKAYSMGFAILQACNKRYLLPFGSVMQHQISMGIQGELGKIKSYVSLVTQYQSYLVDLQAQRINVTSDQFIRNTDNDWWLFGKNAILENVGDEVVTMKCTSNLTKRNISITNGGFEFIYSACPLITKELEKRKTNNNIDTIFYL